MSDEGYYFRHSARFIRTHRTMLNLYRTALVERFGAQGWSEIAEGATAAFKALLADVPYIGGNANPFTRVLIQTASLLALWRQLAPMGMSPDEFGLLTSQVVPTLLKRYPRFVLRGIGLLYLSRWGKRRVEQHALRSQERVHPGGFVYTVVPGDQSSSFWGVDYQECGIVKFLRLQGASVLAPYLCTLDNAAFSAMGIELRRNATIAQGHSHCEFRFSLRK